MCNFKLITLKTSNHCPVCKLGLTIVYNNIFHSFVYNNGKRKSISHYYACNVCGVDIHPTTTNLLDIGEDERTKLAKFLFEETILVSLNRNYQETALYQFLQKNKVIESRLYRHDDQYYVHITLDDFIERTPSHFFVKKNNKIILISDKKENEEGYPLLKVFSPSMNYKESYVDINSIVFAKLKF